jgi:Zn-dependent protease with chaperone function
VDHAAIVALIVTTTTGAAALLVPRRMRPDTAARLITALVVLSFGAAIWMILLVVTANVVQMHGIAERLAWCSDVVTRHRGSFTPFGLLALGAAAAAVVSAARVRLRQRRERADDEGEELAVIRSEQPVAYALPGRPGQVVVSTGMLRSLDLHERRVLIAHERSHLRRGHHRYIRLTELAVAAMPLLRPLNSRVRFAVERWADEDAADETGDRALVACAIARAALASHSSPRLGLAIADDGVVERVEIMLAGPANRSPLIEATLGAVIFAGAAGLVASLLLVEPWVLAVFGICR